MILKPLRRYSLVGFTLGITLVFLYFFMMYSSVHKQLKNPNTSVTYMHLEIQHHEQSFLRSSSHIRQNVSSSRTLYDASINVFQFKNNKFSSLQIPFSSFKTHVPLLTPNGKTEIFIHNILTDAAISRHIKNSHVWEPEIVGLLVKMLERNPEFTFIDLGCNLGVYTLSVAKMGRDVVAVDPLYMNIEKLYHSVKIGKFKSKVAIVNNAVSDGHTNVTLGVDRFNIGGTYVIENKNENKIKITAHGGQFKDKVSTITLDDMLHIPDVTLSHVIIKMDVEGYEMQVLRSGNKFFDNVKIGAIFMEWLFYKSGEIADDIYNFLNSRNFVPYNASFPETCLDGVEFKDWPNDVIWRNLDLINLS